MQSVLNRAKKWGLCDVATPPLEDICAKLDTDLFNKVILSSNHVLHHLLPPLKSHTYQLRPRSHDRQLPAKGSSLFANIFIQRMLFKRSEEHTSELQSLAYLVCRLLLEKKKK